MHHRFLALASAFAVAPLPAAAEVIAAAENGFVSHNEVMVSAGPREVWEALLRPAEWWDGGHTYSGNAANLAIAARAGGCFCEVLPGSGGEVEHMRVIYAAPGATLRMAGALGPLQSEAVQGVLTVSIQPAGEGSRIAWDYIVGGYMRTSMAEMAPLVDGVIGGQLRRLASHLGAE